MFIISQLWLTSHPRSMVVPLHTRTLVTSRKIYSEDADDGTRTPQPLGYKPSALAIELNSSEAYAGKDGNCGPSLTGKTMSVFLIFKQGTHRNVKNR